MDDGTARQEAAHALRTQTGVVIPVCFPDDAAEHAAREVLADTVRAFVEEVGDPAAVCLSADGPGPGERAARGLAAELGVQALAGERNRGKLSAVRPAVQHLLADRRTRYVAVVDQDGDHFANELLNFLRAARHAEAAGGAERVLALGRRISRHRPLGFLRGELEELADRVLLDALHYDAALRGRPLRLEFASALDEFPDFHSGYKLLTRACAEDVFLGEPCLAGCTEDAYWRHAVEAVIVTEALAAGAVPVAVNRSTLNGQPMSAFGRFDRRHMCADKIAWPCRRLGAPAAFVDQWMRNHMPRLLLGTLAPQGRDELLAVYALVLEAFGLPVPAGPPACPRFL